MATKPEAATDLVEWKVDMRLTVASDRKPSGILRKSQNFLALFVIAIFFTLVSSHLRREVRSLQAQMQRMNSNILLLMSRYEELERHLRKVRSSQESLQLQNKTRQRFLENPFEEREQEREREREDNQEQEIEKKQEEKREEKNPVTENTNASVNGEKARGIVDDWSHRAPLLFELASKDNTRVERTKRGDEILLSSSSGTPPVQEHSGLARSGRVRRDEGRGKKRRKHGRKPKRGRGRLGPLVATFVGAIPEQHVTDTVYVGPWVKSANDDSRYSFDKFHLVENKKSVEVTASGLYMISVQIFYFGEPKNYSYWILLTSEGASRTQRLAKCATVSAESAAEVSCYTSVITLLRKGDRLHVQQQERNRLINMREGHSYMQLALLSDGARRKH